MKILVANLGSTSFKYKLFDMSADGASHSVLADGAADRIGKVVRIDARAVRQGEMKALAVIRLERRQPDADESAMERAAWAAFDTFFVRAASGTGPEYVLDKIPISRAPRWAQALRNGERRAPRKEPSP